MGSVKETIVYKGLYSWVSGNAVYLYKCLGYKAVPNGGSCIPTILWRSGREVLGRCVSRIVELSVMDLGRVDEWSCQKGWWRSFVAPESVEQLLPEGSPQC
jgi:hypothetical protein